MRTRLVLLAGLFAGAGTAAADTAHLVYTQVPPCRIIDTRVAGGSLAPGAPRDFRVTGTGLQAQGGDALGCNVPQGRATSAIINFVAVNAVGPGNLRAWAYSEPAAAPPNASIINYTTVAGLNIANAVAVPLCNETPCSFDLKVQADGSGTQLVADVVGYFERLPNPAFAKTSAFTAIAATCTNVAGLQTTITAPLAGKIVVRATLSARISHTQGTEDGLRFQIGTTLNDCARNSVFHSVPAALPSASYQFGLPIADSFNVAPGTYTYYGNAFMEVGADPSDVVGGTSNVGTIEAAFYPGSAAAGPPAECPLVFAPDAAGSVSGVIAVTCSVPGTVCAVTHVGLRLQGGLVLGFDTGTRTNIVNWNTANHPNGSYNLECYAHYQEGGTSAAATQVTVVN